MRVFIAINFTESIIRRLTAAQEELRFYDKYANYSKRENLHLTLAFIGETDRYEDIADIMEKCACPSFELTVSGTGRFGDSIYWAGIERNPSLTALAENLQNNLRQNGFPIEKRRFAPHVTLARETRGLADVKVNIPPTKMKVDRISLMKSERIKGRPVYTKIKSVSLK